MLFEGNSDEDVFRQVDLHFTMIVMLLKAHNLTKYWTVGPEIAYAKHIDNLNTKHERETPDFRAITIILYLCW
jgi:hypothetical protein